MINLGIKPDVVINLGDLIEDFNDHDKDIINLNYIWNLLKSINTKFYSLVGNHDLRSMKSRKEVEDIMGYSHSTFSVDIKGYHFVFLGLDLNSNIGTEEGGIKKAKSISKEDTEWFENDLKNNTLPSLVFCHFGIAEDDMKGNWWFSDCSESALLKNRKEIKEILRNDKNLLAVFSGHQHWTKTNIEDNITYNVVGSLTEDINGNGIPDGVYLEINIENRSLEIHEHHLKINL